MSTSKICIISLVVLVLIVALGTALTQYTTITTITATIEKVGNVKSFGYSNYLITTKNEVFENTDAPWLLKFNSVDLCNEIKPEKTYIFKVSGISFPSLRWYRNIISIESIK